MRAVAAPMPPAAPVTSTTRSVRSIISSPPSARSGAPGVRVIARRHRRAPSPGSASRPPVRAPSRARPWCRRASRSPRAPGCARSRRAATRSMRRSPPRRCCASPSRCRPGSAATCSRSCGTGPRRTASTLPALRRVARRPDCRSPSTGRARSRCPAPSGLGRAGAALRPAGPRPLPRRRRRRGAPRRRDRRRHGRRVAALGRPGRARAGAVARAGGSPTPTWRGRCARSPRTARTRSTPGRSRVRSRPRSWLAEADLAGIPAALGRRRCA